MMIPILHAITIPKIRVVPTHIQTVKKFDASKSTEVPFYSQFQDITSKTWKKVGCGITSLAMIIDYYNPGAVTVDALLADGIEARAYLDSAGWVHQGLINIAKDYGLHGKSVDLSEGGSQIAYDKLKSYVTAGPVMVSVYYKFNPKSTVPHLVVVNKISNGIVYYNDPSEKTGNKEISSLNFRKGWKQRLIVIRPVGGVYTA